MQPNTFKVPSGHTFTESPLVPVTIYTESETDYIDPGKTATDSTGNKFLITEVRRVTDRLFRIVMLPQG